MIVGQGDNRNKVKPDQDIIRVPQPARVPPPVDISSAPSRALAGNIR